MRARELLLEYSHEQTVANFADALVARNYGDGDTENDIRGRNLLGLNMLADASVNAEKMVSWFEQSDLSGGRFVLPMIRWYLAGELRSLEDAPKLKEPIATYVKFRNRIKGLDLKKVSFDQFMDLMDEQEGKPSSAEVDKETEENLYATGQATCIYNEADMKIVIPKTMAASCYFGRNTRWCTASRDKNDNAFGQYSSDGPLFIILDKPSNKRWQFHFDLGGSFVLRRVEHQFMDERDNSVEPYEVLGGRAMDAIGEWARENHFEPLIDAIEAHDNEDSWERGNAWTTQEDEPEDSDQLELNLGDGRKAA